MIVLFIFAFIYYRIAEQYHKNKWIWAAIGGLGYTAIQFTLSIIYGIMLELGFTNGKYPIAFTLIMIAISGGIMYYIYIQLKKKWEAEDTTFSNKTIDEIGNSQNEEN